MPAAYAADSPANTCLHRVERIPVLIIHAHNRCNCRCVMCDIWKNTASREFTLQDLEKLMPGIRQMGVEWVVFSGGEPLMNHQLPEIAGRVRQLGGGVTLLSTGLLLHRFAREAAECFDEVIVALDGPPAVHDK